MTRSSSYGEILRSARKRSGMNLSDAAYRLRIRPDILRAIEECDYSRMPPRGYTRNMISSYARLLGLNPGEITQMYLDGVYAFEVGRVRQDGETLAQSRNQASQRSSSRSPEADAEREPYRNSRGRTVYDDRLDRISRPAGASRVHPSRNSTLPSRQYTNLVASPKQPQGFSKLPYIIAIAVVVILLVIIAVFVLGDKDDGAGDAQQPNVPVAGFSDTSNPAGSAPSMPTFIDVKPTSAIVSFEVASGATSYIEVYVDDACKFAESATGPVSKEFEITGTCRFVTTNPGSTTVLLDGEIVKPEDEDGDGVYIFDVDFADILEAWEAENAKAKAEAEAQQALESGEGQDAASTDADSGEADSGDAEQ